jgi:LuxR family transcriptional regulator, quorum-sensing system regulator BjaR1
MNACATLDDVRDAFGKEAARRGYVASSCGIPATPAGARPFKFLFQNWPQRWLGIRNQDGFPGKTFAAAEATLVVAESRKRMTPFAWSDVGASRVLSTVEREAIDLLHDGGWRNGVLTPIHGPGGYLAITALASMERDLDLGPARRLQLQMLGILAHERACALTHAASAERSVDLSARELECLRWVAAGKTDWEISVILSISAATVRFHLDRARAKLGARTRAQAVARLVLHGLL